MTALEIQLAKALHPLAESWLELYAQFASKPSNGRKKKVIVDAVKALRVFTAQYDMEANEAKEREERGTTLGPNCTEYKDSVEIKNCPACGAWHDAMYFCPRTDAEEGKNEKDHD